MTEKEVKISRRREKKIAKLYRKLARNKDARLERRLRALEQAEANALWKRNKPPVDLAKVDEHLRFAKELLAKHEGRSS